LSDPSLELQQTLVVVLKNNIGSDVGPRIYDEVNPSATFPYVTLGESQVLPDKAECIDGVEVFVQIDVWTRNGNGYVQTKQIAKNIKAVLDDKPPTLPGYIAVIFEHQETRYMKDPDGLTRHAALTFRSLIQPS
jgi:Protein of unknown function (DUF3168)